MVLMTRRGLLGGLIAAPVRKRRHRRPYVGMQPDQQGVFFQVIVQGGGVFTYDAAGNLRSANVGQTTTDPLQGITCYAGFSTFNGHGAVISLFSSTLDAQFWYADTGSSSQGSLVASVASQAGPDPFSNAFLKGDAAYNAAIGVAAAIVDAAFVSYNGPVGGGGPWTQVFSIIAANVGTSVTMSAAGGLLDLVAAHVQVANSGGVGTISNALLEIDGVTAPADPALEIVPHAAGDPILGSRIIGDTNDRLHVTPSAVQMGSGAAVPDVALVRDAAGQFGITDAGGGTVAALRIQAHSQPTTPGSGATFWATGGVMHHLNSAGLDGALPAVQTDATTFTVTAAVATQASKAWSIPAGDANAGTCYRLTVWAFGTEGSTAQNLQFGIAINGVQIRSAQATALTLNGTFRMKCEIILHVKTTGAGGTADVTGNMDWATTATPAVEGTVVAGSLAAGGEAFNTTIANTLQLDLNWASATGAPTITTMGSIFERIGP